MIIGNNNNNLTNQTFNNRFNQIKEAAQKSQTKKSTFTNNTLKQANVNSKEAMNDKAFNMLQERYNNGLISLEEFTKKCNLLNKQRQK